MKCKTRGRLVAFVLLVAQTEVFAHVTMAPRESVGEAEERYTMRVPTERDSPTVRIEAVFPSEVFVTSIDTKEGWRIEPSRAADGRIVSAVWNGGRIDPGQSAEFTFAARNPAEGITLVWKVTQVHEDGSQAEWTGAQGSRNPAPTTTIRGRNGQ